MKYYLKFIAVCIYTYVTLWAFNHVDPFFSITMGAFLLGYFIHSINNYLNKKENEDKH